MMMRFSRVLVAAFAASSFWTTRPVWAAENDETTTAPAGGGQALLAARVIGGALVYRACAQAPCVPVSGDPSVALPLGLAPKDVELASIAIGNGRHSIVARSPAFTALLAAVPGAGSQAKEIFAGAVGFTKGEEGERYGDWLEVTEPDADKNVRVLLGEVREDVTICGRRSILSPKVLDPKDLTFKGARVQRLRREERERAPTLPAVAVPSSAAPSSTASSSAGSSATSSPGSSAGRVLQAVSASSAIGSPSALTDGDLETTWAENRGADGNGEFLRMTAPEQVELTSLSIVARPPTKTIAKGVGPRKIWLATEDALFGVAFAEDPWAKPGAAYEVKFPAPLKTRCLAVVLDEAYVKGNSADVEVTLAEISAHTEFDGKSDPAGLAGALAGGKERSRMAAALLMRGGDAAYEAVARVYPELDDAGRILALDVMDNAPCTTSAPVYVKATEIGRSGEVHHAIDRLTRCQKDAGPALATAVSTGSDKQRIQAAHLLSLIAPTLAMEALIPLLPQVKPGMRAEFRGALTKASQSPQAAKVLGAKLLDTALPLASQIDLLRAATSQHRGSAEASTAFARLAIPGAEFRTRYLLLGPAADLGLAGDAKARDFLIGAITGDADQYVRAHASELSSDFPAAEGPLSRALADTDVRVRDAALVSLARLSDAGTAKVSRPWAPSLTVSMSQLLESDPFTFLRGHAADALSQAPPGEDADKPLARAIHDASPIVRTRAIEALGRRRASGHAGEIRDVLDSETEVVDVRARAARALGRVCDASSLDRLTELARAAANPHVTADALAVATQAAAALGQLNPPDLAKRLAPLAEKGAPRGALDLVRSAVGTSDRCR